MPWFRRAARRRSVPTRLGFDNLESRRLLSGSTEAPVNPSFDSLIGAAQVRRQDNVDGTGLAAAVIDTGADYNNPALGGGFGTGYKVEGGYDFAQNDSDPMADTWSHGTMVSGLIASNAPDASGVAPGADLVPLRVIGDSNQGSYQYVADALQWVVTNHAAYNITVVNISLSDGGNYTSDPYLNSTVDNRIQSSIAQLKALNIPVVCAAGNSFKGSQGMGYTAILSDTISVTGTDQQNHFVADAQRLGASAGGVSATDLAAPGSGLLTTSANNTFTTVEGTSFAAPLVSGAVILLQQIYQSRFGALPSVNDLVSWLKQGSDPITDPATGITIGKLDIPKAAALIPQAVKTVEPPGTPSTADTPVSANTPSDSGSVTTTADTVSGSNTASQPSADNSPPSTPATPPAEAGSDSVTDPAKSSDSESSATTGTPASSGSAVQNRSGNGGSTSSAADGSNSTSAELTTDPSASPASETSVLTDAGVVAGPWQSPTAATDLSSSMAGQGMAGPSPSRRAAAIEFRHQVRIQKAAFGHHPIDHRPDRLAIWEAFRERRQLFRLARSATGR